MDSSNASDRSPDVVGQNVTLSCFGDSAVVCPKDEQGLIQPQERCLACSEVKACLQKALRSEGILPTPLMETPAAARVTGFFKRWSRQKLSQSQPQVVSSDD